MQRGDIVWVDLDPVRGTEATKRRPAVIVSNEGANRPLDGWVVACSRSCR
jgi:mRNA interferase MazF